MVAPFPLEFFIAETPRSLQASSASRDRWKEVVKNAAQSRIAEAVEFLWLDERPLALSIYYLTTAPMEATLTTSSNQ